MIDEKPNDGIMGQNNDLNIAECVKQEMVKCSCRPDNIKDAYEMAKLNCVYDVLEQELDYFIGLPNTEKTRYTLRTKISQIVHHMMEIM